MVMLYNKVLIMWKSKMQKTTALSAAEGEYYSASMAGRKVLYLRALLHRLGFAQKKPAPVYEDNTACIEWGNNVICGRERAKHIDIRKHFAHEVIQNGEMLLVKVLTALQMADMHQWALGSEVTCNLKHLRDLCPQDGVGRVVRPGNQVESHRPLSAAFHRLIGSKGPNLDIDLNLELSKSLD